MNEAPPLYQAPGLGRTDHQPARRLRHGRRVSRARSAPRSQRGHQGAAPPLRLCCIGSENRDILRQRSGVIATPEPPLWERAEFLARNAPASGSASCLVRASGDSREVLSAEVDDHEHRKTMSASVWACAIAQLPHSGGAGPGCASDPRVLGKRLQRGRLR